MPRARRRIRKAAYCFLAAALLLLVADIVSIWFAWYVQGPRHELFWVGQGMVLFTFPPDQPLTLYKRPLGGHAFGKPVDFFWWFPDYGRQSNKHGVPLWMFIAPVAIAGASLWWFSRPLRPGCPTCGYSLDGLASDAKCPECGRAAASPQT